MSLHLLPSSRAASLPLHFISPPFTISNLLPKRGHVSSMTMQQHGRDSGEASGIRCGQASHCRPVMSLRHREASLDGAKFETLSSSVLFNFPPSRNFCPRKQSCFVVRADKDYYSVIAVSKNASKSEIKSAYRKLARNYHPDVNKNPQD